MVAHLDAMLARHAAGEPLAYVLGRWSFRHLDLVVDRRVLIPRPGDRGRRRRRHRARPRRAPPGHRRRPRHRLGRHRAGARRRAARRRRAGVADRRLARRPRRRPGQPRRHRPRGRPTCASPPASWFDALPADVVPDVVVANPPYVADGSPDVDAAVREWEPHGALFAGPDGLDAIRLLVAARAGRVRPGGWLVLEIGADQGPAVERLLGDGRLRATSRSAPTSPAATASPSAASRELGGIRLVSETIPALIRIPPRWGTQPKRTAISDEQGALLGRDLGVDADELAGGREQRPAQDAAGDAGVDRVEQLGDGVRRPTPCGPWPSPGRGTARRRTPCPASPR